MADNQSVKNRLLDFLNYKGIKKSHFEKSCGLSNGYINSIVNTISYEKLDDILKVYPDLNRVWLMTGEGSMLKVDATAQSVQEEEAKQQQGIIMIPVLNLDARGGFAVNEVTDISEYVTEQMPFTSDIARAGDFAMIVSGDSMYPRFPSGSYLLLREIPRWREYLELSVPYLLELEDGRRVAKIVEKSAVKGCFCLKSVNPEFQDNEISTDFIRRVYQIVLSMKKEII